MLRAERKGAASRFVEDLREVLDKCTNDAQELRRSFNKGPLGKGSEAVAFSTTMQAEADQVRSELPLLTSFSSEAPSAEEMLSAAFAQLRGITDVFDRFEERLESAYGIAPVVVPVKAEEFEEEGVGEVPHGIVSGVRDVSSLRVEKSPTVEFVSARKTPRALHRKEEKERYEMPMPKTPGLEDFGISKEDLRGLGMHVSEGLQEKAGYEASGAEAAPVMEMKFGNGDIDEVIKKSISELGFDTPVQVAEKFESRRNRALTKMMVTTTPRLKSGGVERTVDYTGLAGGYYGTGMGKREEGGVDGPRQLNFDETPRVGGERGGTGWGGGGGMEVQRRIAENYEGLGFWCSKVSVERLQEAAVVLLREGERWFDKNELTEVLSAAMPGPGLSYFSIISSLARLKVLEMEKKFGEEAMYRMAPGNGP